MPDILLETIPATRDEKRKKRLQETIQRKRIALEQLVIKVELLKNSLEMTKQEYMVKVGNLFNKDNQLDLEIIQLRNILHLMEQGKTHEQAVNEIAQTYYAEQLDLEREQERIRIEEEIYKKRESHHEEPIGTIKKLWKKLIAKFHPDLVQDPDEKQRRDTIMKKINRAFQEGDYEQLKRIDQENLEENEQTVGTLEEILIRILREIMQQEEQYKSLKKSEWYDWMKKIDRAKKKNINIFADTEKHLLNDIVAKFEVIKDLKKQIETKEKV